MSAAVRKLVLLALLCISISPRPSQAGDWQPWSADLFDKARAENKLVILDLEAVWCHWCHVMEKTTYADAKVKKILEKHFITVRADQDANPDLSSRYGDWGWPATIMFSPEGKELVKRSGYIEPERMVALLEAVVADPTPGPSVGEDAVVEPASNPFLTKAVHDDLLERNAKAYDPEFGGWGKIHRFIDPDQMDIALRGAAKGDVTAQQKVRQTLTSAFHLLDKKWGGIYQYSDELDWKSPHYEKIMWYQANGLRQYSQAYAVLKDETFLAAAAGIRRYLLTKLQDPQGGFYTSQDADAGETLSGREFYALSAAEREKRGIEPRIDKNIYARENGWAISALTAYYAVTGDRETIEAAVRAGDRILKLRQRTGGGFNHGDADRAGPYLWDTMAMGQAGLDLYAATGDRKWLQTARDAGRFIAATFMNAGGGFKSAAALEAAGASFAKPVVQVDEQVAATRLFNRLYHYLGDEQFRAMALHGAKYLASEQVLDVFYPLPGTLLANWEIQEPPAHITIVGSKSDKAAVELHAAGQAFPAFYKRIDWWDMREGPMLNPDVTYPEFEQAAAFVCTNRICSQPSFTKAEFEGVMKRLLSSAARNSLQGEK